MNHGIYAKTTTELATLLSLAETLGAPATAQAISRAIARINGTN